MTRQRDVDEFYKVLNNMKRKCGTTILRECDGRQKWPPRGVYFFFEDGEYRRNGEMRVVRIGTHALEEYSGSTLWSRLRQHRGSLRGTYAGGGNHRGSVFRKHVGEAMLSSYTHDAIKKTWGREKSTSSVIRKHEHDLEKRVSDHIRAMPFIWLEVDNDAPSMITRKNLERDAIGLLSNLGKGEKIDPASRRWLGRRSPNERISRSGLWNSNHVDYEYDPRFLKVLKSYVSS